MNGSESGRGIWLVLLSAAAVFLLGINWGLPSRRADPYLFGEHRVWNGSEILELGGGWEAHADVGADVDLNPIASRDRLTVLNETDAQRAEIVRRYRLFTYQPDEMITLRALAAMKPGRGQLDPKLYQYGGLWIYPIGALLKAASLWGLIQLTSDLSFYLDHPEAFGRFYVVARLYVVVWALLGAVAVWRLLRRLTSDPLAHFFGAMCFCFMPVIVNMAHEAKPHLPGAALMLWAILAASRYARDGETRWALIAGALCGAATGMVMSAVLVFSVLPVMVFLRRQSFQRRLRLMLSAALVGLAVYVLTNPYVIVNLISNRQVLRSNLSNPAVYLLAGRGSAPWNAMVLTGEAMSSAVAACGIIAAVVFGVRTLRRRSMSPISAAGATALLLAVPAALNAILFVSLAGGKPSEYARFGLLLDVALGISAIMGVALLVRRRASQRLLYVGLLAFSALGGGMYVRGFLRDSAAITPRLRAAERFRALQQSGAATMALVAEPAPYSLPPVDLFRWKLVLLPRSTPPEDGLAVADVVVRAVDVPIHVSSPFHAVTPISWAAKPFEALARPGLLARDERP